MKIAHNGRSRIGFLDLAQIRRSTNTVPKRHFDFFIAFASWEPRCIALSDTKALASRHSSIFRFQHPLESKYGDNGRSSHSERLAKFLKTECDHNPQEVDLFPSTSFSKNYPLIAAQLDKMAQFFGRDYSLGIDISTCPKAYLSLITGYALSNGLCSRITYYYSEADYDAQNILSPVPSRTDFRFTLGGWDAISIPYLEGRYRPGRKRHAMVAMGADAAGVEKFIGRYDPDRISLICPIPGVSDEVDRVTIKNARQLKQDIGPVQLYESPAFDVAQTAQTFEKLASESTSSNDDLQAHCLGTKPHALAISIASVVNPSIQVICRVPVGYLEKKHRSNGFINLYELRDLSAPARW